MAKPLDYYAMPWSCVGPPPSVVLELAYRSSVGLGDLECHTGDFNVGGLECWA
jgi:hypothetical protein